MKKAYGNSQDCEQHSRSGSRARKQNDDSTIGFDPNLKENLVQEGYLQGEPAGTDLAGSLTKLFGGSKMILQTLSGSF